MFEVNNHRANPCTFAVLNCFDVARPALRSVRRVTREATADDNGRYSTRFSKSAGSQIFVGAYGSPVDIQENCAIAMSVGPASGVPFGPGPELPMDSAFRYGCPSARGTYLASGRFGERKQDEGPETNG